MENIDANFLEFLPKIDNAVNQIFLLSNKGNIDSDPKNRFKVFSLLLNSIGPNTAGINYDNIIYDFSSQINPRDWEKINSLKEILNNSLSSIISPTYLVVSYWSPIDGKRRTSLFFPEWDITKKRSSLIKIFLFFSLTLIGRKYGLNSLIQFISEEARNKIGINTSFIDERIPNWGKENWLIIPPKYQDLLLKITGIDKLISKYLIDDHFSESLLGDLINILLENREEDFIKIPDDIDNFLSCYNIDETNLESEFVNYLVNIRDKLKINLESEFNLQSIIFILMTQVLWKDVSNNTEVMYTFPFSVSETCCTLTVGNNRFFSFNEILALYNISKTIFTQPLLLDYSYKEDLSRSFRRMNLFRRMLGHNFPKILISPGRALLTRLENQLKASKTLKTEYVLERINLLKVLFNHYGSFMLSVMKSGSLKNAFDQNLDVGVNYEKEIIPVLYNVFLLYKEKFEMDTRDNLKLEITVTDNFIFDCNKVVFLEVLFNFLTNSLLWLSPELIKVDKERGTIKIITTLDKESNQAQIKIIDRGIGFQKNILESVRKDIHELFFTPKEAFWPLVEKMMEKKMIEDARGERMGIGLIFNCSYFRWLGWEEKIKGEGKFEIDSTKGEGTIIVISIPFKSIVRRDKNV